MPTILSLDGAPSGPTGLDWALASPRPPTIRQQITNGIAPRRILPLMHIAFVCPKELEDRSLSACSCRGQKATG